MLFVRTKTKSFLPQGAKEGHVIEIKDDGTLAIDQKETDLRREKNKKLQNSLWK